MFHAQSILLVVLAGVMFATLGLAYRLASLWQVRVMPFTVLFTGIAGTMAGVLSLRESTDWGEPRLWIIGVPMGLTLLFGIPMVLRGNRLGPASITWTVLNLSLLVPILCAPFIFQEAFHIVDLVVLVLFTAMLLIFARSMSGAGEVQPGHAVAYWVTVLALFASNGIFLLGQKQKQILFPDTNSPGFAAIFFLSAAILALLIHLSSREAKPFTAAEIKVGLLAGATAAIGNLCFLGAADLPAVVSFPISQGIALLGGVLLTMTIAREPLTTLKTAGFVLGLLVLMLAVLRDSVTDLVMRCFAFVIR